MKVVKRQYRRHWFKVDGYTLRYIDDNKFKPSWR